MRVDRVVTDKDVTSLSRAAGLLVDWADAGGRARRVGIETLRIVLAALGYPAHSRQDIAHSRALIAERKTTLAPLLISKPGAPLAVDPRVSRLRLESGENHPPVSSREMRAPDICGYHALYVGERRHVLAVVPDRCFTPDDIEPGKRFSGIAVQIPSLRGGSTRGFGDCEALCELVNDAAGLGIDAIMLSPVHALFDARPERCSPYAPSSRLFLNPLLAGVPGTVQAEKRSGLIDWRKAGPAKQAAMRSLFDKFDQTDEGFRAFCKTGGSGLLHHALFEALDAFFRARGLPDARHWPQGFANPHTPVVARFARDNQTEIRFALFQQWIAARSLASAHVRAREKMAIGLVADIAVGVDPDGSHAWSSREDLLGALRVGAPPDAFNASGQNWGLTTFSPEGLRRSGHAGFLEMLRAAMRYAGGIRVDHAMGLERLWVLPEGAPPADGVYLTYPRKELVALLALESLRHRAIVIGEDLGTVPEGFREALADAGVLGMQVLWFAHDRRGGYASPQAWRRDAVAMTTTHDLPTTAGWWSGRDIEWQEKLGHLTASSRRQAKSDRKTVRDKLWSAFAKAGVTESKVPPAKPEDTVEAALEFVGKTRCPLAIAPLEDFVAEIEQPNIPGTVDEHPNWRRRVRLASPLRNRRARRRVQGFVAARAET